MWGLKDVFCEWVLHLSLATVSTKISCGYTYLKLTRVNAQKLTCNSYTYYAFSLQLNPILKILGSLFCNKWHSEDTGCRGAQYLTVFKTGTSSRCPREDSGGACVMWAIPLSLEFPARRVPHQGWCDLQWPGCKVTGNRTFLSKFLFNFWLMFASKLKIPFQQPPLTLSHSEALCQTKQWRNGESKGMIVIC